MLARPPKAEATPPEAVVSYFVLYSFLWSDGEMFPSQWESIAQLFMTPEVNNLLLRTLTFVIQIYMQ